MPITSSLEPRSWRRRPSRRHAPFFAALVAIAAQANAITPATPEQIVCTPTSLIHGVVTEAHSRDCVGSANSGCSPSNTALLAIKVDEVLPGSIDPVKTGDLVHGITYVCYDNPIRIGRETIDPCASLDTMPAVHKLGAALTDAEAAAALVGRSFYFSMWSNQTQVTTWARPAEALAIWKNICPTSAYRGSAK